MSKQLNFEHNGKEYCLEYTRESVKAMEREGFSISDVLEKPMLNLPKLFAGAFKAHHKWGVKPIEIDEIFKKFKNKEALFEKLVEMYNEPMEAMLDEPENEGNAIAWEANF
jgi:hypothetical protein